MKPKVEVTAVIGTIADMRIDDETHRMFTFQEPTLDQLVNVIGRIENKSFNSCLILQTNKREIRFDDLSKTTNIGIKQMWNGVLPCKEKITSAFYYETKPEIKKGDLK